MSQYKIYVYQKGPLKGARERGIYEDPQGWKYFRFRQGKIDSFKPYKTKSVTEAIKMRDARVKAKAAADMGIAKDPDEATKTSRVSVAKVIKRYLDDGCPNKKGVRRSPGKHLDAEKARCEMLLKYFNTDFPAADLVQDDLDKYKDWRVAKVVAKEKTAAGKKGKGEDYEPDAQTGLRAVDLDLNCLNNALRWAVRKTMLNTNPIASRERYYTVSEATHCREFAPTDGDELHHIAGVLMKSRRSETLGWQLLYEGMTGLRTEETAALRRDARADEPGGLTVGKKSMCVRRAKKSKKFSHYVQVHDGLSLVMNAHQIWLEQRYPLSPWYFPGRDRAAMKHINKSVLTKALDRLYQVYVKFRETEKDPTKFPEEPHLTKKYTSHGAGRAFYVLVRRSQGIEDAQIAYELNQTGGVATLEQVYGLPPEHWKNGNAPRLSWLPTGEPAWTKIKGVDFSALQPKKPVGPEALSFDI